MRQGVVIPRTVEGFAQRLSWFAMRVYSLLSVFAVRTSGLRSGPSSAPACPAACTAQGRGQGGSPRRRPRGRGCAAAPRRRGQQPRRGSCTWSGAAAQMVCLLPRCSCRIRRRPDRGRKGREMPRLCRLPRVSLGLSSRGRRQHQPKGLKPPLRGTQPKRGFSPILSADRQATAWKGSAARARTLAVRDRLGRPVRRVQPHQQGGLHCDGCLHELSHLSLGSQSLPHIVPGGPALHTTLFRVRNSVNVRTRSRGRRAGEGAGTKGTRTASRAPRETSPVTLRNSTRGPCSCGRAGRARYGEIRRGSVPHQRCQVR